MGNLGLRYLCTGSCGSCRTEEQQQAQGATSCQQKSCGRYGQPLKRRWLCPDCQLLFVSNEDHRCVPERAEAA